MSSRSKLYLDPRLWLELFVLVNLAFLIASPIITAISGSVAAKRTSVLPELWFVILGVTIALVVGMVFLVVAEALVPSGSVPGLVYVLRGMRRQSQARVSPTAGVRSFSAPIRISRPASRP